MHPAGGEGRGKGQSPLLAKNGQGGPRRAKKLVHFGKSTCRSVPIWCKQVVKRVNRGKNETMSMSLSLSCETDVYICKR